VVSGDEWHTYLLPREHHGEIRAWKKKDESGISEPFSHAKILSSAFNPWRRIIDLAKISFLE
jgi:hypothetical protein